ncbi:Patatin [Rhynchospora pubera]|uniref:Patatin n=1 Tax=Rhynchospora pubera TaxID=906938 RepID=A0AAV8HAN6_9POAL|nr:Patatin [Rhynchospora pubera]KAJ4812411.1 Patatin [Rhynchospora pubera]
MNSKEEMAIKEVHDTNAQNQTNNSTDKLSYEIFSILESKFLFGYTDPTKLLYLPKEPAPPPPQPQPLSLQRGRVCILSIDGNPSIHGGIMASKALSYLEQTLRLKSSNPQARISDYFDLVAGTGVGGVLSAMLFSSDNGSRPLFTADDTWRFLTSWWPKLLGQKTHNKRGGFFWQRNRTHDSTTKAMEAAMKQLFGENLTLKDTLKPVLIPCYDLQTSAPFVFSRADAIESESYDFRLWEVGRATWAEPGRFEPEETRSIDGKTVCFGIDGGLVMSNPASVAITHVLHNKQEFPFVRGVEDILVISLGCGSGGGSELAGGDWRRWGQKDWAQPVARIAADGAAEFVDHAVAMAFGQHRAANYVRIQAYSAPSTSAYKMDPDCHLGSGSIDPIALEETAEHMLKQKNVESVLFAGKRFADSTNKEILDKVAAELIQEHRTRHCRIAPTVVIKQSNCSDRS